MKYVFNIFTGMFDVVSTSVAAIVARLTQSGDYKTDQAGNYKIDQSQ